MDSSLLLKKAYEMLEKVTPLRLDCGTLCNQACCRGDEENQGMYLFPGEAEVLRDQTNWVTITSAEHIRPGLWLATCKGTCPRHLRPLSCRIFPLIPYITENEILRIKMDPRAKHLCPLAQEMERRDLRPEFTMAVRKAFTLLLTDPSMKAYLWDLSRMLDSYTDLPWYRLLSSR